MYSYPSFRTPKTSRSLSRKGYFLRMALRYRYHPPFALYSAIIRDVFMAMVRPRHRNNVFNILVSFMLMVYLLISPFAHSISFPSLRVNDSSAQSSPGRTQAPYSQNVSLGTNAALSQNNTKALAPATPQSILDLNRFQGKPAFTTKTAVTSTLPLGVDGDQSTAALVGDHFQNVDYWVDLGTPQVITTMTVHTSFPSTGFLTLSGCTGIDTSGVPTGCTDFTTVPGPDGGTVIVSTTVFVPLRIWGIGLADGGGYGGESIYEMQGFGPGVPYPVLPAVCDNSNNTSDRLQGHTAFSTKSHNTTANPPSQVADGIEDSYARVGGYFEQADMFIDLGAPQIVTTMTVHATFASNINLALSGCSGLNNGIPTGCINFANVAGPDGGVVTATTNITLPMRIWGIGLAGGSSYGGERIYSIKGLGPCSLDLPDNSENAVPNWAEAGTPCSSCGDPVNTAYGNLWESSTDLSVPGRGVPLLFARTYSSLSSDQSGPLGYGWTHSYNMYIDRNPSSTGIYRVHLENGSIVPFLPDFSSPSRVLGTLTSTVSSLIFTATHGLTTYYFKPLDGSTLAGKLDHIVDRNGNSTNLTYATDKLRTVTDSANRTLTFTYTSNLLTSVSDDAGNRTVSFAYTSGDLTSVTDVGQQIVHYAYETVSGYHRLLTLQDPNGGVVTNRYDSSSRVISQTDALNRQLLFGYADLGNSASSTTMTWAYPDCDDSLIFR